MPEFSAALVVLGSLALLVYVALYLFRVGLTASEMTDAARQRAAGCGLMVLYAAVLACLGAFGVGLYMLARVLRIITG